MAKSAIPRVIITKSTDNLGRARLGQDHISGIIFDATKPVEFGDDDDIIVYSADDAEDAGISTTSVEYYHISEYFRMAGNSQLYVGYTTEDAGTAGSEDLGVTAITRQQQYAEGRIRQIGYYTQEELTEGLINTLQSQKTNLDDEDMPLFIVCTADISALDFAGLPDLAAMQNYGVAVTTDQSGQGTGADLYGTIGKTIGALGANLGTISSIPVSMSVGNVENVTELAGDELDVIADGAGNLYSSKTSAEVEAVASKYYVILMKHPGLSGTYWGNDYSCMGSGDLNRIRLNRTIDKAVRGVGIALRLKINAQLVLNPDGTLQADTRAAFTSLAQLPLASMQSNAEISAYAVYINPDQDVLTNDTIYVQISIVPVGAAEQIEVTIGFAKSV